MSLVDNVHHDGLASFEYEPQGRFALLTDGDHTLFHWGTTELYPDAAELLDSLSPEVIALVTADDNAELAQARADIINAEICVFPADRKHWIKWGLHKEAVAQIQEKKNIDRVVVLGDRWLMDVTLGKLAAIRAGLSVHAELVLRDGEPLPTNIDRAFIHPIEQVGYKGATKLRVDGLFRPRTTAS